MTSLSRGDQPSGPLADVSLGDLLSLVSSFQSAVGVRSHLGDDDDDEDEMPRPRRSARLAATAPWYQPSPEPQEEGVTLLRSGEFGQVGTYTRLMRSRKCNISRLLLLRETCLRPTPRETLARVRFHLAIGLLIIPQSFVPNCSGTMIATFGANVYSGQYYEDGKFFYTCCQGSRLRTQSLSIH